MKKRLAITILSAMTVTLGTSRVSAQATDQTGTTSPKGKPSKASITIRASEGNQDSGQGKGKNKPSIAERPTVIPRAPDAGSSGDDKQKGKPENPGRPDNPALPTEVKSLVTGFQTARETYLKQQKELERRLKDAGDQEREAIRQQMKDSLENWKEQHRQLRTDLRDRAKEIKSKLQPDLGRIIDQGAGEGRGR